MARKFIIDNISGSYANASEAVDHAVNWLEDLLYSSKLYRVNRNGELFHLMRRDLPYCIHPTKNVGVSILVNREYKPLGWPKESGEVSYEDFTSMHVRLNETEINKIKYPTTQCALFNDGNAAWDGVAKAREYMKRLKVLQKMIASSL